jgi:uncharacterized protein
VKVLVLGATGFIGRRLVPALLEAGHEVTALTRSAYKARSVLGFKPKVVEADPKARGPWLDHVDGSQAIINLAGDPILKKKWTPERLRAIRESRLAPTKLLVEAIGKAKAKPEVFLCGSAIGYYGDKGDTPVTEESQPGADGAGRLCVDWEAEAQRAAAFGVRVVNLRTGIVLGAGGGALVEMAKPFKFFAGGPMGDGRQYISWIHIDDHVAITMLALSNSRISGPLNLTAPNPVTNKEFMAALGRQLGRPSWLPVPALTLRLMFGEGAILLLEGQRVLPQKAQSIMGYSWRFEALPEALKAVFEPPPATGA